MFKLTRKGRVVCESDNVKELYAIAQSGDRILLYNGPFDTWSTADPRGVAIRIKGQWFLNGESHMIIKEPKPRFSTLHQDSRNPLEKQGWIEWCPHEHGQAISIKGGIIIVNGKTYRFKVAFDEWWPHKRGIIVRRKEKFILLVYKPTKRKAGQR